MSWAKMIQLRAHKEELAIYPVEMSFFSPEYQHAIEINICKLTPYQQQAIFLRFLEGLPIARVADRLGMSWDGVDQLIDEAIMNLRTRLRGWLRDRQKISTRKVGI